MEWEGGRPIGERTIEKTTDSGYTRITFEPGKTFLTGRLPKDIVSLFRKRAYDIAGTTPGLEVYFNDKLIEIENFEDYCRMFSGEKELHYSNISNKESLQRWQVGVMASNQGFTNVSFVNSIATTKGGKHVDVIVDQIVTHLRKQLDKLQGVKPVKPAQIKQHLFVMVNSTIENPVFDSQTKEFMTLSKTKHGSTPVLSKKFLAQLSKSEIMDNIITSMKVNVRPTVSKKKSVNTEKLVDAKFAGTGKSGDCKLIITEGDSAKTGALAGISSLPDSDRQLFGVLPLRGKIINARRAKSQELENNQEFKSIRESWGLDFNRTYDNQADIDSLRYGRVLIMADQDVDGSHIKALFLNMIECFWLG